MTTALDARVAAALATPVHDEVHAFARGLAEEARASAVLFYGSNLRTGSLEGVLDFYVLLPGPAETGLWPRVSYHEWRHGDTMLRAKVATMALATFREAASGQTLDTTIWARFVQPSALVWAAGEPASAAMRKAVAAAAITAARLAVALGPERGTPAEFWRALFRATYRAEFRFEKPGREDSILSANAAHFDSLLEVALEAADIPFGHAGRMVVPRLENSKRAAILRWWNCRRRLGKSYNFVRLLRASTTFQGAARYAAWKIERHTGVPVQVTPWRERHPVLAAPAVLWRVWREQSRAGA